MLEQKPRVWQILETARELTPQEQLDLLEGITALLRTTLPVASTHSILELEGLGAELWRGINPQTYVNEERASWNG